MNKDVTDNDLILYCYDELDPARKNEIERAIAKDAHLSKQYQHLKETIAMLEGARMNPSQTSIDIIREQSGYFSSLETS